MSQNAQITHLTRKEIFYKLLLITTSKLKSIKVVLSKAFSSVMTNKDVKEHLIIQMYTKHMQIIKQLSKIIIRI